MEIVPQELAWVKARAGCTIEKMFEQLHANVKDDMADINEIRKYPEETRFEVKESSREHSFMIKRSNAIRPYVKFSLAGDCINVSTDVDGKGSDYRITLSDEGRCKLTANGEEREQWQVRKSSLEGLFFSSN